MFAAGCVGIERQALRPRRRWMTGLALAGGLLEALILLPIMLPVVSPSSMNARGIDKMNPDLANTVGWQDMTAQVGGVYNSLPAARRAHAAILASIDGEAGAIDIYGKREHLPRAISLHLNFWYWKPANLDATTLVTVGYSRGELEFLCGTVIRAGTVTVQYSIVNLLQGTPIFVCTNLRESISAAWPRLKNFGRRSLSGASPGSPHFSGCRESASQEG